MINEKEYPLAKFVVLEVKDRGTHRYLRIHRAGCCHAKEPNHKTADTLCHGYFDTYSEAMGFARSLGDRVFDCKICDPRHARGHTNFKR